MFAALRTRLSELEEGLHIPPTTSVGEVSSSAASHRTLSDDVRGHHKRTVLLLPWNS